MELSRPAARDAGAIRHRAARQALRQAIEALAQQPYPHGVRKLRGDPGLWRIRVGGWRVVYTVEDDVLLVLMIGGRGDVYERLRRRLG
ncbi:MAG: type II toxin-antitoxin system RelE/ParE family toxin [Proteobacteria bacterium]|nr:type II toxin-antitoxin system RelE/ParE family toxin [Pseudomonadota bacterium]MCH8951812.1 type II toxin-antitoxin system RelE/ParE family toxin [Pseudomonadota bacterium]